MIGKFALTTGEVPAARASRARDDSDPEIDSESGRDTPVPAKKRPGMSRGQLLAVQLSALMVSISGIVFAWMKYGMNNDDPFSVFNHPWQPKMLALHVITAPLLVFAIGWIFQGHILAKLSMNGTAKRRLSGLLSTGLLVPMIASGYLLQVITHEGLHKATLVTHWVSSGLFVIVYLGHLLAKKNGNGASENRTR